MPLRKLRATDICLPALIGLLSCSTGPSGVCFGVHVGDKITISVVDVYGPGSPYTQIDPVYNHCNFGFDLVQGQSLLATVVASASIDDVCTVGQVSIAPFGAWTWTSAQPAPGHSPQILVGDFTAANGSCTGHVQTVFTVYGKDPFASSQPGQVPNVVLTRNFVGSGLPNCPTSCAGEFVVNLQKT
jgi:hypothetical protein